MRILPQPPPDAGTAKRVLYLILVPTVIGVTIGLGLSALIGVWTVAVVVPPALVWCIREQRWTKRMQAEIRADLERLRKLELEAEDGNAERR